MSEPSPEKAVKDALHLRIRQTEAAEKTLREAEIRMQERRARVETLRDEGRRYYEALLAMGETATETYDKYVREFKRANAE